MTKLNYTLLFCLIFLFNSCVQTESTKRASNDQSAAKKIFRYNQPSTLNSLDPAFAKDQAGIWIANQLYSTLVQIDDGLNIKPNAAKSWEVSEDGLVYTFKLRDDIYFHDHSAFENGKGERLTAHDVAFSFNRIMDDALASPGRWIFENRVADKEPFKALDDYTFQLTLQKAFRPIMGILSMQYCSIVPQKVVEALKADFRTNAVGSGPFKLKKWLENEVLILEKNANYYEKVAGKQLPFIDGIKVTFNENKKNAYLKFIEGELDFLSGIDPSYVDEILDKSGQLKSEHKANIDLQRSPYLNTEYLGFMLKDGNDALMKKEVRQAINYGFERKKMIQYLRNGVGIPGEQGFVPPGLPSFDKNKVKGYEFDQQKARELLAKAGYPNGKGLPKITLETTAAYKDLCTFIQKQLADIGIKVEMVMHPSSFLREKVAKGEADFFRGSWIADYPDAETYFTVLYGAHPAPPNYTRFKNAEFDKLYQEALAENDNERRYELYRAMDRIVIEEAPIVPLYYDEVLRFKRKNIKGLGNNAFNLLSLKTVDMAN